MSLYDELTANQQAAIDRSHLHSLEQQYRELVESDDSVGATAIWPQIEALLGQ